MSTLILFDVDGTLILTGGAGMRAMGRAFHDVFAIPNAFDGVPMPGRTDTMIVNDALRRAGIAADASGLARFRDRYLAHLEEELERPHPGKRIMPGVRALLDALADRDGVFLALLTGNYTEAARAKLTHFNLWRYFTCGAYGEDADDRNGLVPIAVARVRARGTEPCDVIVVGDTPHDIACAKAGGARSIAVATGFSDRASLEAAGADVVLDDLSDTSTLMTSGVFFHNP